MSIKRRPFGTPFFWILPCEMKNNCTKCHSRNGVFIFIIAIMHSEHCTHAQWKRTDFKVHCISLDIKENCVFSLEQKNWYIEGFILLFIFLLNALLWGPVRVCSVRSSERGVRIVSLWRSWSSPALFAVETPTVHSLRSGTVSDKSKT